MSEWSFRLHLPGIKPDQLSFRELSLVLEDLHALLKPNPIKTADGKTVTLPEPVFSLVAIEDGSTNLACKWSDDVLGRQALENAVEVIRRRPTSSEARRKTSGLMEVAKRHGTPIEVINPEWDRPLAEVRPDEEYADRLVEGETVLYGRLVRVGGLEPKAWLVPDKGGHVVVSLSIPLAQRLAPRLYQEVGLKGVARWSSDTWEIDSFTATELLDYDPGSILKAFDELAEACGPCSWDRVDNVVEAVIRLREGGDMV